MKLEEKIKNKFLYSKKKIYLNIFIFFFNDLKIEVLKEIIQSLVWIYC